MIPNISIFLEGKSDHTFIDQYIQSKFGFELPAKRIQSVKGKDSLHLYKEQFQKSSDSGIMNLVIFDADTSFQEHCKKLEEQRTELKIDFDYFMFPNHQDEGDLEVLLERISMRDNQFVFDCFEQYMTCLSSSKLEKLNLPARKTKIYAYLDVLGAKAKVGERNYLDPKLWDMNSQALTALHTFLSKHINAEQHATV
jgi:hypothetical protein